MKTPRSTASATASPARVSHVVFCNSLSNLATLDADWQLGMGREKFRQVEKRYFAKKYNRQMGSLPIIATRSREVP
jgi:hypothetical protein